MNNVPINTSKTVPPNQVVLLPVRKNVHLKDVIAYAEHRFDTMSSHTDFTDIMKKFRIHKKRAQRILKNACQQKHLFTLGYFIPQHYYPKSRHFEVVEYLKKINVPKDTTSTNTSVSKSPLSTCLESLKASSLLDTLMLLKFAPLYTHKLQLLIHLGKEYYEQINGIQYKGNRGRQLMELVENRQVIYIYHRNGNLEIHITCNNKPFRLDTYDDVDILCSFFGQVRDRLEYHISDPHGRLVPHIPTWTLKQCDFNKDIPISDNAQVTLPDIQLKSALETFRLYVKNVNGSAHYRIENSACINGPLTTCLASAINPNQGILSILTRIEDKMTKLIPNETATQKKDP